MWEGVEAEREGGVGGVKWEISQKPILVNVGHEEQRSFLPRQPLLHVIMICY